MEDYLSQQRTIISGNNDFYSLTPEGIDHYERLTKIKEGIESIKVDTKMDRRKIMEEILELVDSNPLNDMDIQPIIMKYSEGLEFSQQQQARSTIVGVLLELKNDDDITFVDGAPGKILGTSAMAFFNNSVIVRSRRKRDEKLKSESKPPIENKINIQHIEKNLGIANQGSEFSHSPITHGVTMTPSKKQGAPKVIRWYSSPLFEYFIWPLTVAVLAALIVYCLYR